jgi:hypothetical protein
VFKGGDGAPRHRDTIVKQFHGHLRSGGIGYVRPHDLRHTYGSLEKRVATEKAAEPVEGYVLRSETGLKPGPGCGTGDSIKDVHYGAR